MVGRFLPTSWLSAGLFCVGDWFWRGGDGAFFSCARAFRFGPWGAFASLASAFCVGGVVVLLMGWGGVFLWVGGRVGVGGVGQGR